MTATPPAIADRHAALGARAMPLLGATVAAHYGDPEGEHRAAATACAVLDLSAFTIVRATGADHRDYLNRRLSQKVDDLAAGDVRRSTLLGAEGRMQADLELLVMADSMLAISTPASSGPALAALLDRFVFSEDARFADETAGHALFAVLGPRSPELLKSLGLALPMGDGRFAEGQVVGAPALLWPSSMLGGEWALLVRGDGDAAWNALLAAARKLDGGPCGFMPFDSIRIESGTPWWGIDLDERTIPLDARLHHALSQTKGCYPGQETIAKITNLGHPARQLVGIVFDGEDAPAPGTPLQSKDGEAGRVTSAAWSPALHRPVALAMVRWSYRTPGAELTAGGIRGVVTALPLGSGGA